MDTIAQNQPVPSLPCTPSYPFGGGRESAGFPSKRLATMPSSSILSTESDSNADRMRDAVADSVSDSCRHADSLSRSYPLSDTLPGQGGQKFRQPVAASNRTDDTLFYGSEVPPVLCATHTHASPLLRSQQQRKFYSFCTAQKHFRATYTMLSKELGIAYGTLRGIVRRLNALGLIASRHYSNFDFQGLEIKVLDGTASSQASRPDWPQPMPFVSHSAPQSDSGVSGTTATLSMIDRLRKDLSIWSLDLQRIRSLWPHTAEAGLTPRHLQMVADAFSINHWGTDEEACALVVQSLRYLEWQIEQGGITDRTGAPVAHPVIYWLRSMQKNGGYQRPAGYTDAGLEIRKAILAEYRERVNVERGIAEARNELEELSRKKQEETLVTELAEQGEQHPLWVVLSPHLGSGILHKAAQQGTAFFREQPARAVVRHAVREVLKGAV